MTAHTALTPQTNTVRLKDLSNAVRALAMDAVEKAQSGHPGMPMGMADVATVLFTKFLKVDPANPLWPDRDRFILSAGHGSMLLYALNYLMGYEEMTLEQIKNFRQLGSICAGHPEYHPSAGIEMTTGPLGQGIATAVGFALAEVLMANKFEANDLVDHNTYVIASDGDLMEGISHEACSLAGHLRLSKLIVLYDDNGISIDGETSLSFSDDTKTRFESYGWDVQTIDGHDFDAIETAIAKAQDTSTPSLIACKTKIGFGAPTKEGKSSSHGSPLGAEELAQAKENIGWDFGAFEIPDHILSEWRSYGARSSVAYQTWQKALENITDRPYYEAHLNNAFDFEGHIQDVKKQATVNPQKLATRQCSGLVLDHLVGHLNLIGGSADLTGSNNTKAKGSIPFDGRNHSGNYIYYGVREHAMAACMNGIALHGGFIPYSGTFLVFSDYCRPSIRLAALMKQQVIHVMTHDSIGLGEDGPTHQPVEHLSALRAIPNTYVFRPADLTETAECWELALNKKDAPSVLALSRQGLEPVRTDFEKQNLSSFGAYILIECEAETPDLTLFASGSETELAVQAAEELSDYQVRVVSCPCLDLFWEQDGGYIQNLLCNKSVKIAIEAGNRQSWDGLIGGHSSFIGMNGFGDSAPAKDLYQHFGITVDNIVKTAREKLEKK